MDLVAQFTQKYGRVPTEFDPDYLEMLRMSKYRILSIPDFKPGKCANCGSSKEDGRSYVDFGLEIDWYGIVYICSFCLNEIAKKLGLFRKSEEQIGQLQDSLLKVKKVNKQGTDLRDSFLQIFKEVQDYFASLPAVSDEPPTNSSAVVDEPETIKTPPSIATIKSAADAAKSGTTKPSTVSRSKNIPSLAELLNATE